MIGPSILRSFAMCTNPSPRYRLSPKWERGIAFQPYYTFLTVSCILFITPPLYEIGLVIWWTFSFALIVRPSASAMLYVEVNPSCNACMGMCRWLQIWLVILRLRFFFQFLQTIPSQYINFSFSINRSLIFLLQIYVQLLIQLPHHNSPIPTMPTAYKNSFWACCSPFDLCTFPNLKSKYHSKWAY